MNTEKLIEMGNLWEKGIHRRVYFDIKNYLDLEISTYNTGNIKSAYLNGEKISNSKAGKILQSKIYFDLNKEEFMVVGDSDLLGSAIENIKLKAV